ncbi:MAG: sensory histidine kinase AtoS [Methanomassiliicoccales archaeon PtaU1.Bin124]|nr:MAG: sensory histidine kinase AtoS [Methanomassiliicoccales archaeon PtaU1.Bin124]
MQGTVRSPAVHSVFYSLSFYYQQCYLKRGGGAIHINVLYVDDEPALLEITKIFLERFDEMDVSTAECVQTGLEMLRDHHYDIVISDYQMPVHDGIQFLKAVRAEFDDLPFILFTGKGREAVAIEALNYGADYYVQKGVDVESQFAELSHKIRLAVGKRLTENRLTESERRLREMMDHVDILSLQLDRDGKITYANTFAAKTLGCSISDLMGRDFFSEFVPQKGASDHKQMFTKIMLTGKLTGETLAMLRSRNGSEHTIKFRNSLIRDRQGKVIGMSNVGEDVTDLLKAQEERDVLVDVVSSVQVEFYIFDVHDLHFYYANDAALSNWGITAEEIVGLTPKDIPISLDEGELRKMLDALLQGERTALVFETERRRADGTIYPTEVHLQLFDNGRKRMFIAVAHDITERKRLQSEIKMSELRYRGLVENFYGMVYVSELDSKYLSQAYGQTEYITGYGAAEFENREITWTELVHPDDLHVVLDEIKLIDADHSHVMNVEFRLMHKDGRMRWVKNNVRVVSTQGNPIVQGTMVDITSLKLAEEELQASNEELQAAEEELRQQLEELTDAEERTKVQEERFHNLFVSMNEGVALHKLMRNEKGEVCDYMLLDVNPSYERILELRREDVIGKASMNVYHVRAPYLEEYVKPMRTGEAHVFETYFPPMDKHFLISAVNLGRDQFATVFIDITESKRLEEELKSQMKGMQELLDLIPGWVFKKDTEGRYLAVNRKMLEEVHLPAEKVLGRTDLEIFPRDVGEVIMSYDRNFLEGDKEEISEESEHIAGNHRIINRISMRKQRDRDGKVRNLMAVLLDVTDIARAKDSLRVANRKLNLMASITRHDLSNHLQVMRGYIELAKKSSARSAYLDKISSEVDQMEKDVEFTRTYQGLGEDEPRWQRLEEVVDSVRGNVPEINVTVDVGDREVFADPMLKKVFYNLLDNSNRHGGKVRNVRIGTEADGQRLRIVYQDDGSGLSDEKRKALFSGEERAGSGHGMVYSKEVLGLTGMNISEEGAEGKGARFVITVPPAHHRVGSGPH